MKSIVIIFLMFLPIYTFSQTEEKETVNLLFNIQSKERYSGEDGSGNSLSLNKFRKELQGDYIHFKIGDETFTTHVSDSYKETCSINILSKINLVDINYLLKKHDGSNEFKHHVFDKIYIIEKISEDKVIKYEVSWIDEILMIDD